MDFFTCFSKDFKLSPVEIWNPQESIKKQSYDYVLGWLTCLHYGGYLRLGKEAGERDYLRNITIAQKMLMKIRIKRTIMRIDKMRYIGAKLRLQNIRFVWLDDRSS